MQNWWFYSFTIYVMECSDFVKDNLDKLLQIIPKGLLKECKGWHFSLFGDRAPAEHLQYKVHLIHIKQRAEFRDVQGPAHSPKHSDT